MSRGFIFAIWLPPKTPIWTLDRPLPKKDSGQVPGLGCFDTQDSWKSSTSSVGPCHRSSIPPRLWLAPSKSKLATSWSTKRMWRAINRHRIRHHSRCDCCRHCRCWCCRVGAAVAVKAPVIPVRCRVASPGFIVLSRLLCKPAYICTWEKANKNKKKTFENEKKMSTQTNFPHIGYKSHLNLEFEKKL